MSSQTVILDVREAICAGREPFTKIMKAVAELRPDERLLLIAPFEPQPLVKILESLAQLPAGAELRARTDRRPMRLYAQREERGFYGDIEEQADGSFITKIRATKFAARAGQSSHQLIKNRRRIKGRRRMW